VQATPSQSYYAVFDGHGGAEAAVYCSSQLHIHFLKDSVFAINPELALKKAYTVSDRQFLQKAEDEV
jgi:protein phosphatase 1E